MRKPVFLGLLLALATAGAAHAWNPLPSAPPGIAPVSGLKRPALLRSEIDISRDKMTAAGRFKVSIAPRAEPIPINRMHGWVVSVMTPDGAPVGDATLEFGGAALGRQRLLPTVPRVTRNLGGGKYLVEGVRFNMAGWWTLKLTLESGQNRDHVSFNIEIK